MRAIAYVLLSTAALVLSQGTASARQHLNGNWVVDLTTETGTCRPTYTFPLTIQAGQVHLGGPEGMVVGTVSPEGAVRGGADRGSIRADVTGRLTGAAGSGAWALAGSQSCTGQWRARKAQ